MKHHKFGSEIAHDGFVVRMSIVDHASEAVWKVSADVGIYEGEEFVPRFPSIERTFAKTENGVTIMAYDCGARVLHEAREIIDHNDPSFPGKRDGKTPP